MEGVTMANKKRQLPKQTKQDREREVAVQKKLDILMMRRVSTVRPQDLIQDTPKVENKKE